MPDNRVLELRLYKFHPGQRAAFAERFRNQLLPMIKRHGMEVIHYGPSLHDEDSFFIIRAYASAEARNAAVDSLYSAAEWLMNHEQDVLDMIVTMNSCVFEADDWTIGVMAESFRSKVMAGDDEDRE